MIKTWIEKLKALRIYAVISSKIKNMDYATKFDYLFLRPCVIIFVILLILKLLSIITVSWWVVFLPIIIPILLILKELGVFRS
jgi:hypothetical protein